MDQQSKTLNESLVQMLMNPSQILLMDQYPDILKEYPIEKLKELFESLASLNNPSIVNKVGTVGGYTAIHWMCIRNEMEMIQFLVLNCKADVNVRAAMGETPLHLCVKNCNLYTTEFLIENHADLNARDSYNRSVIHWSAYAGKVIMIYYFQKYHGLNDLNELDQFEQNVMHIACSLGFQELIRYLVDHGQINLYAQDCNGNSCLHLTALRGLPRISWLLTQQNNGQCIRLITLLNKQNQTPFDLIRNENTPNFRLIRNWLRLELKTNDCILSENKSKNRNSEKKADEKNLISSLKAKSGAVNISSYLKWNSFRRLKFDWFCHFLLFPLSLLIPMVAYRILFDNRELSLWNGIIGYFSLPLILYGLTRQRHRIANISGEPNPYNLGLFACLFACNYITYFSIMLDSFDIMKFNDFLVFCGSMWHLYCYYRIITDKSGFAQESIKKPDGTPYEIKDLMKLNAKYPTYFTQKDSIRWLTDPSYKQSSNLNHSQYVPACYFCESCLIIQSEPTKHCKLCEGCCTRFDHHCVFIAKCVGLKNHRSFIYFLMSSIIGICLFCLETYRFSIKSLKIVDSLNEGKPQEEQTSAFYFFLASQNNIWVLTLAMINGFSLFGTFFLLMFQLRFLALGFTTQFGPPNFFFMFNNQMKSHFGAIHHRLNNLRVFFFGTQQALLDLYYRQQKDHWAKMADNAAGAVPCCYPRDDSPGIDGLPGNHVNTKVY